MNPTLKCWSTLINGVAFALAASSTLAQSYPSKPVTLVVSFAPGTVTDLVFRSVGGGMSKVLNAPVIIDNRTGANGVIAWEYVVRRQPADGYTLAASTNSSLSIPVFTKDLAIDPVKELFPVAIVAESPLLLHSPINAPWNSMAELVTYAKANPGKLNWAASGSASVATLNTHAITQRDSLDIVNVPFQGGNTQAIVAVIANDVQLLFSTVAEGLANTQSKKTKGLGLTGEQRLTQFPGVPILAELGYPGQVGVWWALNVRPGTPPAIVEQLFVAARSAVQQQEVKDIFSKAGITPMEQGPDAVARRYESVGKLYREVAARAGIKPQ